MVVQSAQARSIAFIHDARKPKFIGQQVEIYVRVAERGEIMPVVHDGRVTNSLPVCIVQDRHLEEIELTGIAGNDEVDRIVSASREQRELQIIAQVVVADGIYKLSYIASRKIDTVRQLIGAQADEVERAAALVQEIAIKPGGLLQYLRTSVIDYLRVQQVETFPALRRAIDAAIFQSVCHGRINETPASLHILLVGPPGTGKRTVHRVAQLLNPVFSAVSSSSVTVAGLVGVSASRHNRTRIIPGVLARSHLGVISCEDLQNVDVYSQRHTFGLLSDLMERGQVCRTIHGHVNLKIEVGSVFDINPKSTMRPAHTPHEVYFVDDLGLPLNFLSRVDVAIEFPRDTARQIAIMKSIIEATHVVGPEESVSTTARVRELQVLIAYLRDSCVSVEFTDEVRKSANTRVDELFETNVHKLKALNLAADFILRSAKSIMKLIGASARLHGRCEATETDVEIAFDLFSEKIRFICMIEPDLKGVETWTMEGGKQQRQRRITEHYSGRSVTVEELEKLFVGVCSKTLTRDLKDLGAKHVGGGVWEMPQAS